MRVRIVSGLGVGLAATGSFVRKFGAVASRLYIIVVFLVMGVVLFWMVSCSLHRECINSPL